MAENYCVKRYEDNQTIGIATLTSEQWQRYLAMSQQPQGLIRLGALPHDWYSLDDEFQGTHEDTAVYLIA